MPATNQPWPFLNVDEALIPDERTTGEEPHVSIGGHCPYQGGRRFRIVAVRPLLFAWHGPGIIDLGGKKS
jgi:hypothetical protein